MIHHSHPAVSGLFVAGSLLVLSVACNSAELVDPADDPISTAVSGTNLKAPSNLTAVVLSERRVDVSWKDNSSNESAFELYISRTGATGAFGLEAYLPADSTVFEGVYVTGATEQCYKVRALKITGPRTGPSTSYSAYSNIVCVTTPLTPASGLNASPAGSTIVGVTWVDNSVSEAGFRLERSLDAGSTWATAYTAPPDYTSGYDFGLTGDQEICYRVVAFGGTTEAPPSNTDCTTPPLGPTNLVAANIGQLWIEIELTWTDNSAVEDGYEVWVFYAYDEGAGAGDGYWAWVDRLPANSTRYVTASYPWGPFRVVATKDGGYSDSSNDAAVP